MLNPSPVRRAFWWIAKGKPSIFILFIKALGEFLILHGVRNHHIKPHTILYKGWVCHGVSKGNVRFHVMDKHVHLCHGVGGMVYFLTVKPKGCGLWVFPILFQKAKLTLYKKPSRPTTGVVYILSRLWVHNVSHHHGYFLWSIKLSCGLPRALRKLTQEILISPSQEVWCCVLLSPLPPS